MSSNPGPTLTSFSGFGEEVIRDLCGILFPLFAVLRDQTGQPVTVRVDAQYADEATKYPQVVPRVVMGAQTIEPGNNVAYADTNIGGNAYYGGLATDAQILFDVYALSDPQRQYLMSYLRYGIQTAYTIDTTTNRVINFYILKEMDDTGIIPKRFIADVAPAARITDAREYGQVYRATVGMMADVAWSVAVPLSPYPPITIGVTGTPDLGYQPSDAIAAVTLYVPTTLPPFPSVVDPPILIP